MTKDLDFTQGSISKKILLFSLPLMAGNIFQQLYNVVDTLIVGRFLGEAPLAAVGSAYTLMIFITSILIGLTMGSGVYFSICHGQKNTARMKQSIYISFLSIGALSLFLNAISYIFLEEIIRFMQIPADVASYFRDYLLWIFSGIIAVFLYNYFAALLRAVGNSLIPLVFLIVSALLNIALDLLFILVFQQGVAGAAKATVIAEYASGLGILCYCLFYRKDLLVEKKYRRWDPSIFRDISRLSLLTSLQQSIMNFGILLVQGLVNSFGTIVMAAFAAGVKIDTLAYSPLMDFGNAFSTAIAQNYGLGENGRLFRSPHERHHLCLRPRADGLLRPRDRDRNHRDRRRLPPYRRGLLHRHRHPLHAVCLLSRHQRARDERHPDHPLPRKPRHPCLCHLRPPPLRRHRHLALHPYRLGDRRCVWGVERGAGKMTGPVRIFCPPACPCLPDTFPRPL